MKLDVITKEDVTQFLHSYLVNEKKIDPTLLKLENNLKDLNIDSFSFLEIIFSVEHQFDILFPQQFDQPKTLGDVVDLTFGLIADKHHQSHAK